MKSHLTIPKGEMCKVTGDRRLQELLSCYLRSKKQRHSGAGRRHIADKEGASRVGIKRALAKSVRRHFQDVVLRNYIRKVTQRNTGVAKSSAPEEDQMTGDKSSPSRNDGLRKCVKHTAGIKEHREGEGNKIEG